MNPRIGQGRKVAVCLVVVCWLSPCPPLSAQQPKLPKLRHTIQGNTESVSFLAFSSDGKTLASASDDPRIRLWDVATGKNTVTMTGHTARVCSLAFSPDGKTLASSSGDKSIKLWDVATGKSTATFEGHTDEVSVVFTQTARPCFRGYDKDIKPGMGHRKEHGHPGGTHWAHSSHGHESRRQDPGVGEHRQEHQALGRGHRKEHGHPDGTHG